MPATVFPKQYTVRVNGAEKTILRSMNLERKENGHRSCEVILVASGARHYAHKIVLTSFSDFFRQHFEENPESPSSSRAESEKDSEKCKSDDENGSVTSNAMSDGSESTNKSAINSQIQTTIPLPGINSEELGHVLEYMYASELALKAENVNEILLAGNLLQITSLIKYCAEVLLKQPSWRSPLVSDKLLKLVKGRGDAAMGEGEAAPSSSTVVTWAKNGIRPTSNGIRDSRHRGSAGRFGTINYAEKIPAGPNGQGKLENVTQPVARKRRYPNWPSSDERSRSQNIRREREICSVGCDTTKTVAADERHRGIPTNINFVELNRELARNAQFMNLQRNGVPGSLPQRHSPSTSSVTPSAIPPPLLDIRTKPGAHARASGVTYNPRPESISSPPNHRNLGPTRKVEFIDIGPGVTQRRYSGENQPVTMFPQMGECNRSLTVCASALGIPMFHTGYLGFPFVHPLGGLAYAPNYASSSAMGSPVEKRSEINYPTSSCLPQRRKAGEEHKLPINHYTGSASAIYATPNFGHEYQTPQSNLNRPGETRNCYFVGASGEHSPEAVGLRATNIPVEERVVGSQATLDLSYRPAFKRFCPNTLQRRDSATESVRHETTASNQVFVSLKNDPNLLSTPKGVCSVQRSTNVGRLCLASDSDLKQESVTSDTSSASMPDTIRSNENNGTEQQSAHVDYHKRKRKLLRGAQDDFKEDIENSNNCLPTNLILKECSHFTQKSQCSSEDEIIARECHQMDVSDPESDDSGRPSSV